MRIQSDQVYNDSSSEDIRRFNESGMQTLPMIDTKGTQSSFHTQKEPNDSEVKETLDVVKTLLSKMDNLYLQQNQELKNT